MTVLYLLCQLRLAQIHIKLTFRLWDQLAQGVFFFFFFFFFFFLSLFFFLFLSFHICGET